MQLTTLYQLQGLYIVERWLYVGKLPHGNQCQSRRKVYWKPITGIDSLHEVSNDNVVRIMSTSANQTVKSINFPHRDIHKHTDFSWLDQPYNQWGSSYFNLQWGLFVKTDDDVHSAAAKGQRLDDVYIKGTNSEVNQIQIWNKFVTSESLPTLQNKMSKSQCVLD
jgi:hypothetical protein